MKRIILSSYIILATVALCFKPLTTTAQTVNSLYFLEKTPFHTQWNPAMAPNRSGMGLGIGNMSFSLQSDLALNDVIFPGENGQKPYTFLDPKADANAFLSGLGDISSLKLNTSMDIFNLGIRILNNYFTFHSGIVFDAGIGIPKDLFKMIMVGMDENKSSTAFDLTGMNINAMSYAKMGVGYSMKVGKLFSVGINANYLLGISDMRLGFDKLTVDAGQNEWRVTSNGYIQMAAPNFADFEYNEDGYFNGLNFDSNSLTSGSIPKSGSGFSIDLGVTAKPLSFLTLSAAVIDLGSIKWDPTYVQRAESNGSFSYEGVALNESAKENVSSGSIQNLEEMVHFEKDNSSLGYTSRLTTKLNIGAEAGILNNKISFGVLSQTGFAENGSYQDVMLSANFKPANIFQGALTYSLLHGEMSAFGAAINVKLPFLNFFMASDYIPLKVTPQYIPINNSYYNFQFGINMMF